LNSEPKKLVVLDDDDLITELVVEAAQQVGIVAEAANEFETFKNIMARSQPDLILIDLVMPGVDGIQVLRYLAGQKCQTNILLMSGFDPKVVQTAQRLGLSLGLNVEGVLSKPVSISALKSEIKRAVRSEEAVSEEALRDIVSARGVDVHLQPKVRITPKPQIGDQVPSGVVGLRAESIEYEVVGFEALARWKLADGSFIPPSIFIPMAEENGLIQNLTFSIYRSVVKVLGDWNKRGHKMSASINISPRLMGNLDLPDILVDEAAAQGVTTDQIVLEMTESATMADAAHIMEVLTRFRLKGFGLSLDDFGTGYSSLIQLYRMPFTELKVDRSFVSEMEASDEAFTIVRSIISLGHNLGMDICAEGVEFLSTGNALSDLGCDYGQGYYYSRPQPADSLQETLNMV
jgi:EAL domain-containing protein (putative c-di-GMP-specific phosphodiesterase class I)